VCKTVDEWVALIAASLRDHPLTRLDECRTAQSSCQPLSQADSFRPEVYMNKLSPCCHYSAIKLITRDHSFPSNTEFWAEPRNLPISVEFLCFHGILQNSVLDGDKKTKMAYFDGVRATILYVYMISPWNTWLPLGLWREEYWKY